MTDSSNPFSGLGEDSNPFEGLGGSSAAASPLDEASAPGAGGGGSSWWDRIWTTPEVVMKPIRAAADWMTAPSASAEPLPPDPDTLGSGTGLDPNQQSQVEASQRGLLAGATVAAGETFLSPGNVALMLISGGASASATSAINAGSRSRFLAEALQGATKDPAAVKALVAEFESTMKAFGAAKFWANAGATTEALAGTGMSAHGVPLMYQGVKERDVKKFVSGLFETAMGAAQVGSAKGRFIPGGPPGPGRPRRFYEGTQYDEPIGPTFEGLGAEPGAPEAATPPAVAAAPPVADAGAAVAAEPGVAGGGVVPAAAAPVETAPAAVPAEPVAAPAAAEPPPAAAPEIVAPPAAAAPADGWPEVIAPRPGDQPGSDIMQGQPGSLPEHIAPSILQLPTDVIEDPSLRIKAEDIAQQWSKVPSSTTAAYSVGTVNRGPRNSILPPELEPYRTQIGALSDGIRNSRWVGNDALRTARTENGQLVAALPAIPTGIWRAERIPGYVQIFQVHEGKIVGLGEAIEGKTAMITGGKEVGSPVSARPLFEYMRAHFEPDTLVTSLGELTRRRKIRSYIEEQRKNGPPSEGQAEAASAQHDSVGAEVRPADAEALAPQGDVVAGGGAGAEPAGAAEAFAGLSDEPVAAGAGGVAGGPPAEGGGSAAGVDDASGAPGAAGGAEAPRQQTVGATALNLDAEGPPSGPPGVASPGGPGGGGDPLPKYAGAMNLWRVAATSEEDVARVILETYQAHEPTISAAERGEIPIREQQGLADELGLKLKDILATAPGTAKPAEWLRAAHEAVVNSARLTLDLAAKHSARPTPESRSQLLRALASHVAVQAKVSGVRAEAGRALGTLRYLDRVEKAGTPATVLQALVDEHGGNENLDLIADLLSKISPDDIRAVNRFASKAIVPTTVDKIYEFWLNGLLSGPPTHMANILSNTAMVIEYPVETLIQAGAAHLASLATGKPRQVFYGEAGAEAYGVVRGIREGVGAAMQGWKTERPVFGVSQVSEIEGPAGAISGLKGRIIRSFGTRALTASDEFFKAVIYRMTLNGRAYSNAIESGARSYSEIGEAMARELDNPSQELIRAAEKQALYRTFNKDPNAVGRAALTLRRELPLLRWIIPFVRTPVNIVEFGGERIAHPGKVYTFGKFINEYRAGKIDTRKLSEETAKNVIGVATAFGVAALVSEGRITGGGPTDPGERRTLAMALTGTPNYPSYSFKIGGDYYSFGRAEPLGIMLGMTADFVELNRLNDYDELPARFLASFRKNFGDKTWVSGVTALFKAYSDEERYGKAWALKTIASALPNVLAVSARAIDPTRRLPNTPGEAFEARIPGMTDDVPAAIDLWGKPEVSPQGGLERFLSPVMRIPATPDATAQKLVDLKVNIDVPSKKVNEEILQELGVKQLPAAQIFTIRQARGMEVHGRLQQLFATEGFGQLPAAEQKKLTLRTIADARGDVSLRVRGLLLDHDPLKLSDLTNFLGGPPAE